MTWTSNIILGDNFTLEFLEDVTLNLTRIDNSNTTWLDFLLSRSVLDDLETNQTLIRNASSAALGAIDSAKILSEDPGGNWLTTEGRSLGSTATTQILGSGIYEPEILFQTSRGGETAVPSTIKAIDILANTLIVSTEAGETVQLSEQGTGTLNLQHPDTSFSITVRRLGANRNGFALYPAQSVTGSIELDGQTYTSIQPGYFEAAMQLALRDGLLFDTNLMPQYGETLTLGGVTLESGTDYGILFFNDDRSTIFSSFSAANPGYSVQTQTFLPQNSDQIIYSLEDISQLDPRCDRDYNDLILVIEPETHDEQIFEQLAVFGDSLSDFGSRAAAMYRQVLEPNANPAWSGSTFSNAQSNWQTDLREALNIPYDQLSGAGIVNTFVGGLPSEIPASTANSSYAMGGALSGRQTLFDTLANLNPPQFPPALLGPPYNVSGLGVQSQIEHALTANDLDLSQQLTMLWSGGNDLLSGNATGESLETILSTIYDHTEASLISLLRTGNARSLLVSTIAPISGVVDGVTYTMPFLTSLPPEWQVLIANGASSDFNASIKNLTQRIALAYPYASITFFNNEYGANWDTFGDELGNFSNYGIEFTTVESQNPNNSQPVNANEYLYFDDVHPTESGHQMIARAIELTLEAEKEQVSAARIENEILADQSIAIGTQNNDKITAFSQGSRLEGLDGNDWLIGGESVDDLIGGPGNDLLDGGGGSNVLRGGAGADSYKISTISLRGGLQTITDFSAEDGDRILLSEAFATAKGDLFFVPTGEDWSNAVSFESSAGNGLLTVHFNSSDQIDGWIALPGVSTFETSWLS